MCPAPKESPKTMKVSPKKDFNSIEAKIIKEISNEESKKDFCEDKDSPSVNKPPQSTATKPSVNIIKRNI